MTLPELIQSLEKRQFKPVYFFYGDEPYNIEEGVKRLQKAVVDPATADFNYDCFYGEEADGDLIVQAASSFPMMAEQRLVVVKNVQRLSTSSKNRLLSYVEAPSDSTVLVLTANRIDKRQKFYSRLAKLAADMESKPLYENQAVDWMAKHLKARGLQLNMPAVNLLVQKSGTSLWGLRTEADKLLAAAGGKTRLEDSEVAELAGYSRSYTIWELTDRVGKKDLAGATEVLQHMLSEGQSGIGVIIDLYRRFTLLLRIRSLLDDGLTENQISSQLNLKYYFAKLYLGQARKYSVKELLEGIGRLQAADIYLKTGRMEEKLTMTLLIHELIKGHSRSSAESLFVLP